MARNNTAGSGKAAALHGVDQDADPLAHYRRRVKRAFRRPAAQPTGTAVANPGVTEEEDAQRARHPGMQPSEGENT